MMRPAVRTRVLVADDQEPFRLGIRALLSTIPSVLVCGEARNGREAVDLALRRAPDVVLMDIRMPVMDGIAATREICRVAPAVKVLVLTTFDDDELVRAAITAGAFGYVLKDTPADDLGELIAITRKGYAAFAPGIVRSGGNGPSPVDDPLATVRGLTERERAVLRELSIGATNKHIATTLGITDGTVRNYVSRILMHLGVRTRTEAALVARAVLDGIVPAEPGV
jgi:DNA-binding NarL/FixJ family response regulator